MGTEQSTFQSDFLYKAVLRHSQFTGTDQDFYNLAEEYRSLSGAMAVVVNEVSRDEGFTTTRAIAIERQKLLKAAEIIGFPLLNASYGMDEKILQAFKKDGLCRFDSVCELSSHQIPQNLCAHLMSLFNIGSAYVLGIKNESRLLADIVFIFKKGDDLEQAELIQLFGEHTKVMLQQQKECTDSVFKLLIERLHRGEKGAELVDALFASSDKLPDLVYQLDAEGRIVFINQAIQRYGYLPSALLNKSILDIVHPDDREKAYWHLQERRTGDRKTYNFEVRLLTGSNTTAFFAFSEKSGSIPPTLRLQAEGLYRNEQKESFIGTIGIGRDVTAEIELRSELNEQTEIFKAMAENVGDAVWLEQIEPHRVFYTNPAAEQMFRTMRLDAQKDPKAWLEAVHPDDREKVADFITNIDATDRKLEMEYRIKDEQGDIRWIYSRLFPVYQEGRPTRKMVGIATDTTRQKEAQLRLEEQVEAEKWYVREISHRVKNNFNMIDSMLSLELDATSDAGSETAELLRKIKGRIQSVGLVHEMLYGMTRRGEVEVNEYLQALGNAIFKNRGDDAARLELQFDLSEDVYWMSVKKVIPLGMILNELITNALKYAFDENETGMVSVGFGKLNNGMYCLSVCDDGKPFPEMDSEAQSSKSHSIGMSLVKALAKQIDGDLHIRTKDQGKAFELSFKDS